MAAVVRFDPFRDISTLRDEVDRVFSRTFGERLTRSWTPALDVYEDRDRIVLTVELPGLTADDIELEIDDNVLTISGERTFEEASDEGRYHRVERAFGRFSRSVTLPNGVRTGEITADVKNGVLAVTVPKADEVKPRKIAVGEHDEIAA
jgi:HSP20 family protein